MLNVIARFLARPSVANWIIRRAQRTPYSHLEGYMNRWWLFNAYENNRWHIPVLPSIRIHHILRRDLDRHMHDHPWDARTFILRGWYAERRPNQSPRILDAGETARINFGDYHSIISMPPEGVWTMFVTFKYRGTWGFLVNGRKVPWRKYFGEKE